MRNAPVRGLRIAGPVDPLRDRTLSNRLPGQQGRVLRHPHAMCLTRAAAGGSPSSQRWPVVAESDRRSSRNSVDLPHLLGPMIQTNSPDVTSSVTGLSATRGALLRHSRRFSKYLAGRLHGCSRYATIFAGRIGGRGSPTVRAAIGLWVRYSTFISFRLAVYKPSIADKDLLSTTQRLIKCIAPCHS